MVNGCLSMVDRCLSMANYGKFIGFDPSHLRNCLANGYLHSGLSSNEWPLKS